jgi:hypothetical protein
LKTARGGRILPSQAEINAKTKKIVDLITPLLREQVAEELQYGSLTIELVFHRGLLQRLLTKNEKSLFLTEQPTEKPKG